VEIQRNQLDFYSKPGSKGKQWASRLHKQGRSSGFQEFKSSKDVTRLHETTRTSQDFTVEIAAVSQLWNRPEIKRCWLRFSLRCLFSLYFLRTGRSIECYWRVIFYSRGHWSWSHAHSQSNCTNSICLLRKKWKFIYFNDSINRHDSVDGGSFFSKLVAGWLDLVIEVSQWFIWKREIWNIFVVLVGIYLLWKHMSPHCV
jgi:hypothetical protein